MPFSIRYVAALAILGFSSAALAEQIDNPEYAQWSKYKPGTYVTMQQKTEMPGMANMPNMPPGMDMSAMLPQTSTTTKLTEVKPDALTLEVTTVTTTMGNANSNTTTRKIPAKIDKPAATTTAPATAPTTIQGMTEGTDTLEIKGKSIATTTREMSTTTTISPVAGRGPRGRGTTTAPATNTATPAHVKIWSTPEIPGGTAKTETTTTADQIGEVKMTMTVIDFDIAK